MLHSVQRTPIFANRACFTRMPPLAPAGGALTCKKKPHIANSNPFSCTKKPFPCKKNLSLAEKKLSLQKKPFPCNKILLYMFAFVMHTQATTASYKYENLKNPRDFHSLSLSLSNRDKIGEKAIPQRKRVYPYPLGAGSARPKPKIGAPENPLFLGFSVLRGESRPLSQTMVSEGARPWGRGRSGDCEFHSFLGVTTFLQHAPTKLSAPKWRFPTEFQKNRQSCRRKIRLCEGLELYIILKISKSQISISIRLQSRGICEASSVCYASGVRGGYPHRGAEKNAH